MTDKTTNNRKRRGGRPPIPPENRLTEVIRIRVTADELAHIKGQASIASKSVATYGRQLFLEDLSAIDRLTIPLAPEDKAKITHNANASGFTVLDYARKTLLNLRRPSSAKVNASMVSELNRVGNNLNQEIKNHNAGRLDAAKLHAALALVTQLLERFVRMT